jgi:hypothetical protein
MLDISYPKWSDKKSLLPPLLGNFALECTIREVQKNQVGMQLNGAAHQLLVYADINPMRDNTHTIMKNRSFN